MRAAIMYSCAANRVAVAAFDMDGTLIHTK